MKQFSPRELLVWIGIIAVSTLIAYSVAKQPGSRSLEGEEAPAISGIDTQDKRIALGPRPGVVTVLNLYANWCPPCRQEIPEFSAYYSQVKNRDDVDLVALVFESGQPGKAISEAKKLGIDYPVFAGTKEMSLAYGLKRYPTTVVIGPEGKVRAHVESALDVPALDDLVRAAKQPIQETP